MSSRHVSAMIAGLAAALALAGAAMAAPVETSPRPKARPGGTEPAVQAVRVASTALPATVLRPLARPEGLATRATPVSANNPAFTRWIQGFRGRALGRGISARVFDAAFRNARYEPEVIAKDRNQTEFRTEIWDYLDNAAAPPRVDEGRKALRRHSRTLSRIEAAYGVEAKVVVAVWGLESRYGTRMGDYPMIDALATLAFDGRRGRFFEDQLVAALKILQSGDVRLRDFTGSWAGAMGHTQFIPTSYLAYAVDFTGDGRRDIWSDNPADALASTAAYLKRFGWRKGMPWGVEVKVPRGATVGGAKRMPSDWAKRGVVGMDGRAVRDFGAARIIQPAGPAGASFMVFANFDVIKRYNNADAYAIAVGHLSDRINGGPPIRSAWPRGYDPLSFDQKKELQRRLKRRGYGVEKIDGLIGPNTVDAIRAFQRDRGITPDGHPSQQVLRHLGGG
ncbi:lytic murein transglycosylase [Roseovarius amoyensis]|uniref:lytic murein transglycosylase n=1 Tax=Roseovarius amoyensis TaxID=2211448 RepID=UPI001EF7742B|nr:lytic murein transglycosylase [Roseovarius amoyensis]